MSTNVNIGAYKARFNGRMSRFYKGVLIKLFGAVIMDTPVDTGRLRANWKFGKDAPPEDTTTGTDTDGAATVASMTQGVTQAVTERDAYYYLANSMPYANRIEYHGWSHTKAPEGMVRRNVTRIAKLLRQRAAFGTGGRR